MKLILAAARSLRPLRQCKKSAARCAWLAAAKMARLSFFNAPIHDALLKPQLDFRLYRGSNATAGVKRKSSWRPCSCPLRQDFPVFSKPQFR